MLNRLIHAALFTVALSIIAGDYALNIKQTPLFEATQSLPHKLFHADIPKLPLWFNWVRSIDQGIDLVVTRAK
jgi:hypothetical protein